MAKPDKAAGLLASLGDASTHLHDCWICFEALLADAHDGHDFLLEMELRDWLTAFAVVANAFSVC